MVAEDKRPFERVQPQISASLGLIIEPTKATREKFLPNPKLRLREQLREVMRFKQFSPRAEAAYWHWIRGFILFHQKRHPREMGTAEVQASLSYLAAERDVAPATQNQALNALVFLSREVLAVELGRSARSNGPRADGSCRRC